MPLKTTISVSYLDYSTLDNTLTDNVAMTERDKGVLLSAFITFFYRECWDEMTENEWDDWSSYLASISAKLE